jgi:hypothetical protein
MAGELVPLVLLPRYTTFVGADTFLTIGMDISQYESALVNVWRTPLNGTAPTWTMTFEQSSDQITWSTCTTSPTPAAGEPAADAETLYTVTLTKRWFRIKVVLGGTQPAVSCWAVGFLEQRQS